MHNRITTLLLIVGMCATAAAAPNQKPLPSKDTGDDVHVTVTAGRGRLGLAVIHISSELRAFFGAPGDRGVLVDSVRPDNPAAKAGIRVGDIVLDVDGAAIHDASEILEALADRKKGERASIVVLRAGKRMTFTVTLDTDPGPRWEGFEHFDKGLPKGFNWRFFEDDNDLKKKLEDLERRLDKLERT